jgi:diguanylate cyclase
VYQPIRGLRDGRLQAVEALARWNHPTLGELPPSDFIPLAEETGLIGRLGAWIVGEACRQLRAWRAEDTRLAELVMHVNLSAHQLRDPELPDRIRAELRAADLPAGALTIEVTEGAFSSEGSAIEALRRLRALGLQIAIDDFGTGYSTLGRLQTLPVDMVKIDRSFVEQLSATGDTPVVRAMVELSDALGLVTVAEGIETEAQRELLVSVGCATGQGYLLGRPSGPGELFVNEGRPANLPAA